MPENAENEDKIAAAGSQEEAVQASDANAEATAKASDELTENDLDAVAGGYTKYRVHDSQVPTWVLRRRHGK